MSPLPRTSSGRRPASEMPAITGVRLMPHDVVGELVNISETGLLTESTARLQIDSAVTVHFVGGFSPATVTGRVARCQVAVMGLDGLLRYATAIEFDAPIQLDGEVVEGVEATPAKPVRNRW